MTQSRSRRSSRSLFASTLVLGAVCALAPGTARAQVTGTPEPLDESRVYEVPSVDLVTFKIGALSTLRLIGVPEEDEVVLGEEIPAGGDERFLIDPTLTPAQLFARLAPRDTPVPRMIADHDATGLLAGRPVVEALERPIDVDPALFGLKSVLAGIRTKGNGGSCQTGNAGADFFESHHCGSLGGPGYGSSESYCDSGSWNNHLRASSSKRRATWAVMAACGTGNARMSHYYDTASSWHAQLRVTVHSPAISKWWSYRKGGKRYRWVRVEEQTNTAWVRGWSIFWSEVADGW